MTHSTLPPTTHGSHKRILLSYPIGKAVITIAFRESQTSGCPRKLPLIYTDGTWTEEVAALVECGVKIHEESPAELIKALNHAYEEAKQLKEGAVAGAERVKQYHSCEPFRSTMLQHSTIN